MGTFLKATDLVYDAVIPFRRKTTNATVSGVLDTINCREVWFISQKGLVHTSTTAYKVKFWESDTLSGTASGMTAIASGTLTASVSTTARTRLDAFRCGNGTRKRFIGVTASTTAGSMATVGVLGVKVKNEQYPASSTGFTTVTYT